MFSNQGLDRAMLVALACHVVLKIVCLLHMKDTLFTGDERMYLAAGLSLGETASTLLTGGDLNLAGAFRTFVGPGWFMPGMAVLLLPMTLAGASAVEPVRLYVGLVALLLFLGAVWQVRRQVGRSSALVLVLLLGLSPMWTLFSLSPWDGVVAGLVLVILAARLVGYGRSLVAGRAPGLRSLAGIGALLATVLFVRSSALPLVPLVFLLLALLPLVILRDAGELKRAFRQVALSGVVFLALLLPWSALVSAAFRVPVLTTTTFPLALGISFGDKGRLCDGPCPSRPGESDDIWFSAVRFSSDKSVETSRGFLSIQREMARDALRGLTPGGYFSQVKQNFANCYLHFDEFMDRFTGIRVADAPMSLVIRNRAQFGAVGGFLYWSGFALFLIAVAWPVRVGIDTQIRSLVLKVFALGVAVQPFVMTSHGGYWPLFAPLCALSAPFLLSVIRESRGVNGEPGSERRLFASQLPFASVALVLYLALAVPIGDPGRSAAGPYSDQLHVHGSFSEGIGSMDSHSHEADRLGVDVIWWSDHDHRIASYLHVSRFGFEDWHEPIGRSEPWSSWDPRDRDETKWLAERRGADLWSGAGEFTRDDPFEGARSLRVQASSASRDFRTFGFSLATERFRERRPLASDVAIHLAVRPELCGPDARPFVGIALSEHAPVAGLSRQPYNIEYFLDNQMSGTQREGAMLRIPLRYREGEWNEYELAVTRDAVKGFPFIDGEDNSLHRIEFGVAVRRGARASADFDDLRIEQQLRGEAAFSKQRTLLGRLRDVYLGVRQLQGVEISHMSPHLNEFSVEPRLLDYDAMARESGLLEGKSGVDLAVHRRFVAERAVEIAHARGGLVSLNHALGTALENHEQRRPRSRDRVASELIESRAYGADLLEVGYRMRGGHTLEDFLWIWDELTRAGLFLVGIGTSDSHGGREGRWFTAENNFVSWIHADSIDKSDLIEGMRAGRVFFGDPTRFAGSLDLRSTRGAVMGQTVLTDRSVEEVDVEIVGVERSDRVRIVTSEGTEALEAAATEFRHRQPVRLPATGGGFVRVEVYGADGRAKVFSNPIRFVRRPETATREAARSGDRTPRRASGPVVPTP